MMDLIVNALIGLVTAAGTGLLTWAFAKKKYDAEVSKSRIENIDMAADTWQKMVNSLESQLQNFTVKMDALRTENNQLRDAVYQLQTEISELKSANKKLICKVNELQKYEKKISDTIDSRTTAQ